MIERWLEVETDGAGLPVQVPANNSAGDARAPHPRGESNPVVRQDSSPAGAVSEEELADDAADMEEVGRSTMAAITVITAQDGPYKDWTPAEDPAEIITDLYEDLLQANEQIEQLKAASPEPPAEEGETMRKDAERYRWLRAGNALAPEEHMIDGGEALDRFIDQEIAAR